MALPCVYYIVYHVVLFLYLNVSSASYLLMPPVEAACELCGLFFENRKALASHARAHLRQFGVTEWCVNGSPIETLREWMKQRPQKAGAYLNYIQGRPFSKKFKRALQSPKPGPEKVSPATTPTKVEKEHSAITPNSAEKPAEPQGQSKCDPADD